MSNTNRKGSMYSVRRTSDTKWEVHGPNFRDFISIEPHLVAGKKRAIHNEHVPCYPSKMKVIATTSEVPETKLEETILRYIAQLVVERDQWYEGQVRARQRDGVPVGI